MSLYYCPIADSLFILEVTKEAVFMEGTAHTDSWNEALENKLDLAVLIES